MKLVSIITPVFNNEQTIRDCLYSLYRQTYLNIEHIVVDNCSTDNTLQIIEQISFPNRTIISEKDNGLYDAINKGIKVAKGDIVGILHADDFYLHHQVIEKIVSLFRSDYQGVYANLYYVNRENTSKIVRKWKAGEYQASDFLYGWMPPHPTCFVTKSVYEQYGLYRTDMGTAADYEWILRVMYKHRVPFEYLNDYIIAMRAGGMSNASVKSRIMANINDRKAWEVNQLKPYFFTLYLKPLRKIAQFLL
ncbi:MAG: glycosyl transferase [Bacteroidia bacterium]|nr:MAG: glycosyl transferase [Bacteroidia bacterium]